MAHETAMAERTTELRSAFGPTSVALDDLELLADFTGLSHEECVECLRSYRPEHIARAWRVANPRTPDEVRAFYSGTDLYLWALLAWNGSSAYDHYRMRLRRLAQTWPPERSPEVLDYGAGIGTAALELGELGYRVTVADLPGTTLDFAQERLRRRGLRAEVIEVVDDVPALGTTRWDAIVSFDVLEHVVRPAHVARTLVEALKTGGGAAIVASFGGEHEHPEHLADGVHAFGGYRFALYLQSLGMRHLGHELYEKVGGLGRLARRARYALWRATGLHVQRLER